MRSSADSDPDSELSSSTSATYDNSDNSDFGAGPSAPNMALGVISTLDVMVNSKKPMGTLYGEKTTSSKFLYHIYCHSRVIS